MRLNQRRRHYLVTAAASGLLGLFIVTVTYGPTGPGDVVLGPSTTTTTASRPSPPPSLPLFTVPEQTTTSTVTATVGTDVNDPAESDGPSPTVEKPRPVSVVFRPIEPGPARSDVLVPRPPRFRLTPPGSTTPRRTTRPTAPQTTTTTRPPTATTRPPTTTTAPPTTTTTRPPTTTTSAPLPTTVPPTTTTVPPTTTTSTVEPTTTVSTTTSPTTVSTTTTTGSPGPSVEIAAQEGPLS